MILMRQGTCKQNKLLQHLIKWSIMFIVFSDFFFSFLSRAVVTQLDQSYVTGL